ncbi:MAG: hypothetical protein QGF59_10490 [Pirellulaceae bacterium]|jgi:hypothetical protein|nr:hypothetical protein [Pirellulaceae bacterium]
MAEPTETQISSAAKDVLAFVNIDDATKTCLAAVPPPEGPEDHPHVQGNNCLRVSDFRPATAVELKARGEFGTERRFKILFKRVLIKYSKLEKPAIRKHAATNRESYWFDSDGTDPSFTP